VRRRRGSIMAKLDSLVLVGSSLDYKVRFKLKQLGLGIETLCEVYSLCMKFC
jgi:hypothetical protein